MICSHQYSPSYNRKMQKFFSRTRAENWEIGVIKTAGVLTFYICSSSQSLIKIWKYHSVEL